METKIKKFEYYIQKDDISPKSTDKFDGDYEEDDSELKQHLNDMGALGWELCGIIHHPSDPDNAKFVFKRELPEFTKNEFNIDKKRLNA